MKPETEKKKLNPIKIIVQWILILVAVFAFFAIKDALTDNDKPKEVTVAKQESPKEKVKPKKEESKEPAKPTGLDSQTFSLLTAALPGKSFIKEAVTDGFKGIVTFYGDFETYKADNPNSQLTKEDYNMYFRTGDGLEKALFTAAAYLFEKMPDMTDLQVTLPFEGKTYSYDVTRDQVKDFIGADQSNDDLRAKFIQEFVRVN